MMYPYLPGSDSDAFKGVSVFVGLLLSIGSAGTVNQAVSGLMLMYSRALRVGDYVQIGETEGTVVALGMFSTRIRTPKGEIVSFPNAVIVGTTTKNYSREEETGGVASDDDGNHRVQRPLAAGPRDAHRGCAAVRRAS